MPKKLATSTGPSPKTARQARYELEMEFQALGAALKDREHFKPLHGFVKGLATDPHYAQLPKYRQAELAAYCRGMVDMATYTRLNVAPGLLEDVTSRISRSAGVYKRPAARAGSKNWRPDVQSPAAPPLPHFPATEQGTWPFEIPMASAVGAF